MDVLQSILAAIDDFARWLWNSLFPPERKAWCAVLYFVSQEDQGLPYPEKGLDPKLEEALRAVRRAARGRDLHVVYRAVWSEQGRDPFARVAKLLGKTARYFDNCSTTLTQPIDTGRDMECFLNWVYRWCPADHYAVFFWGHSFGPAGIFEPGAPIVLPRPGLPFLRAAFEQFNRTRAGGNPSTPPPYVATVGGTAAVPATPAGAGTGGAGPAVGAIAGASDRIEIVLFQDCWMATLETTYELRDVVKFLIASQSLVPIGVGLRRFYWPYSRLFDALLAGGNVGQTMLAELEGFYNARGDQIAAHTAANGQQVPGLRTVPYALIDASVVHGIAAPVKALVSAIDAALPPATSLAAREALFRSGQIATFDASANLTAGDVALVDLPQLCAALAKHADAGVTAAAANLNGFFQPPLIVRTFESVPFNGPAVGFGGLSALYRPSPPNRTDTFITDAIYDGSYLTLALPATTGWPGTEQPR